MEPIKEPQSSVDDLLEVILNKGIILHTDMIISVANIPLIGISLKAAIASVETMLKFGMMETLDQKTRQWALTHIRDRKLQILNNPHENIAEEMYGSCWCDKGIYHNWRPGKLFLTDKKMVLYQQTTMEIIHKNKFRDIRGVKKLNVKIEKNNLMAEEGIIDNFKTRTVVAILLRDSNITYIYVHNVDFLVSYIKKKAVEFGVKLNNEFEAGEEFDT